MVADPVLRVRKAIPGAQITSGYRDPAHNAAVGGKPNSAHTRGEAVDFIAPQGMKPAAVEAALRGQGKFDQIDFEGNHVHYSDDPRGRGMVFGEKGGRAPSPWEPVQADPWSPVTTAPAQPASPASGGWTPVAAAPDRTPVVSHLQQGGKESMGTEFMGELKARTAKGIKEGEEAAGQIDPLELKKAKAGWDVVQGAGEAAGAVLGRKVDPVYGKPGSKGNELEKWAALPAAAAANMIPGGRGMEEAAAIGKDIAGVRGASNVVGLETDPFERVDNALFRLGRHSTSGMLEALEHTRDLPQHVREQAISEDLWHAIEHKMIDPTAQIPAHLQEGWKAVEPWLERQRAGINSVYQRLVKMGMDPAKAKEYLPDTGYVPRRVVGKSPAFDASQGPQSQSPLAIKAPGGRNLSRTTGSMRQRDQIVLQFDDGTRTFEHRNPSNDAWEPGMKVRNPMTGKEAEVKQATVKEIEGAKARDSQGNLLTYHKNPLVNSIDEALKVERVNRNLQVLGELTKNLRGEGMAFQKEWHYQDAAGQMVRGTNKKPIPEGFKELPNIPQLKGWYFDKRVTDILHDYYPEDPKDLDKIVGTINRALNASLFITPFPHIKNVATMGFVGRGWDWMPTVGNYARLAKTGHEAVKEVLTLGPKYREWLREGAAMQAGDDATRNFYDKLMQSAAKGIAGSPKAGKAMGLDPVSVGKAMYGVSHKVLWNVNDMIMFQRYLELQAKGMAKREAIKETERWIANYRVPAQIMGNRAAAEAFKSGLWINFGRYNYGKWRAIGEMIKGLSTKGQRVDAMGKVAAAGVASLILYPMMDKMLQKATGNEKAKFGMGGELQPVENLTDEEKNWPAKIGSLLTPSPLIETAGEVLHNRNAFTGKHLIEPTSPPGAQAAQGAEYAASKFYPAQLGIDAAKHPAQAAGRLFGASIPPDNRDAKRNKAIQYERRAARKRVNRDPLQSLGRDLGQ